MSIDQRLRAAAPLYGRRDFYAGAYEMGRLLLTSPRMNRPQREVIEEQAGICKEELEKLGVAFMGEAA